MRMIRVLLGIVLLTVVIFKGKSQSQEDAANGFELVKDKDDIFIYERWVKYPKSDPAIDAREVKGVFFVKSTFDEALGLVQNDKKIKEWQSHVSKFKVYPLNDTAWYEYSYHDIPWPVSDQDHFLIYKVEKKTMDSLFVTFESFEHTKLAPVDEDADRMKICGSWLFEKRKDKLKITYSIMSWPSNIPRLFTDPVIRGNMMSTIKSYIKILEAPKNKKASDG
jgi:hypothetical protein